MLSGLCSAVKADFELELVNTAHTSALLLKQLFEQAEKWHLKLQADISELENRCVCGGGGGVWVWVWVGVL